MGFEMPPLPCDENDQQKPAHFETLFVFKCAYFSRPFSVLNYLEKVWGFVALVLFRLQKGRVFFRCSKCLFVAVLIFSILIQPAFSKTNATFLQKNLRLFTVYGGPFAEPITSNRSLEPDTAVKESPTSKGEDNLDTEEGELDSNLFGETWLPHKPPVPQADRPIKDVLLLGIVINGQDMGGLEILIVDEGYLIPLKPFAELTLCEIENKEEGLILKTPLGEVNLTEIEVIGGVQYLNEQILRERLLTEVNFDQARFALIIKLPWQLGPVITLVGSDPKPEIKAPANALSGLRSQIAYQSIAGNDRIPGYTALSGLLGGGIWRMRYDYDIETDKRDFPEYSWLRTFGNRLFQVGHQRIRLHPLLGTFMMTGAQGGWTNSRQFKKS